MLFPLLESIMKGVLVVDDSATMRRMVIASLRNMRDAKFDEASSGLEAIERLALGPVDLVILDLNMPDMHGFEVLQFLRGHPSFQTIPVLVLTTKGDEGTRSEAFARGASQYMTKPFEPQALAKHVRALLDH
jgi:two-component system, chemotaxis family, chemotaxis protein CheY